MVQVLAAAPDDREQPADASVKVWIGLLARQVAAAVVFGGPPKECDVPFLSLESSPCLPFAAALVQVADAQFGFATARSGADASHEARLKAIEASLEKLSRTVSAAVGGGAPATKVPAPPKLGARAKTKAPEPRCRGAPPVKSLALIPLSSEPPWMLASRPVGSRSSNPCVSPSRFPVRRNELDEADGRLGDQEPVGASGSEAPSDGAAGAGVGSSPIEHAVVALTKIVGELSRGKRSPDKTNLEAALDKAEGFSTGAVP